MYYKFFIYVFIYKNILLNHSYMDSLKEVTDKLGNVTNDIKFLENVLTNTIKNKGDNVDILIQSAQSKLNTKKSEKSRLIEKIKELKKKHDE
jgi:hypothetical protein